MRPPWHRTHVARRTPARSTSRSAGAGVGLVFKSSVGLAGSLAPAESRGEVLAAVFLIAYAGITLPVLAVGAALLVVAPAPVLVVFAALVGGAVVATTTRLRRALA